MDYLKIQEPVLPLLGSMEKILADHIGSKVRLISDLRRYTPIGKGKKIRAAFFFLMAGMNRLEDDDLAQIAAAIEMLHLSSLVHDDIMDHSAWRRGEKTPNHHFGDCLSVLWGDFLFIHSFRMLTAARRQEVIGVMLETSRQMVEGQILEFENSFNYRIRTRTYYDIIRMKTASMFAGIADLVARLQKMERAELAAFHHFGQDFGMIFQISDDLLDVFSDHAGKSRFQDLKEGKITLPYILLLQNGAQPLIKDFKHAGPQPLLKYCRDFEIKKQVLQVIGRYQQKCARFLRAFPPSVYRDALENLLEFIRYREY